MIRKTLKIFKRMLLILLTLVLLLIAIVWLYMQQDKFGAAPSGARLERIKQSGHYKDGQFQNLTLTPSLAEGKSMAGLLWDFLFGKYPNTSPLKDIPSVKTDLLSLPDNEDVIVWFGHSSYFIKMEGITILVDPVFSGNASPIPGSTTAFKNSNIYTVNDLPKIDFLLISHDHYDHLDYETIVALQPKVTTAIMGLGVGAHFEKWKYNASQIVEKDWDETVALNDSIQIHVTPARHFSGRTLKRNNTLWVSYVLETKHQKIFIGGDSGYEQHFKKIGDQYGPFDIAIIENGQYNSSWPYIHLLPEQQLQTAKDLQAKRVFPVHSSKFNLANHSWDEPLTLISKNFDKSGIPLITPIIGEKIRIADTAQVFKQWWKD